MTFLHKQNIVYDFPEYITNSYVPWDLFIKDLDNKVNQGSAITIIRTECFKGIWVWGLNQICILLPKISFQGCFNFNYSGRFQDYNPTLELFCPRLWQLLC